MARAPVPITVLSAAGVPLSGATVNITKRPSGFQSLYGSETGGGTTTNPATTDSKGRITAWLPPGAYIADVTGPVTYSEPFDIRTANYAVPTVVAPTALPAAIAGDEVYYSPLANSGVQWHLRHDGTKWQFMGGSPWRATVVGPLAQTIGNADTLITGGPTLAFPWAGLWTIEAWATANVNVAHPNLGVFPAVNAVPVFTAANSPRGAAYVGGAIQRPYQTYGRRGSKSVTTAGHVLALYARPTVSTDFTFYDLTVAITPERTP